MPVYDYKCPVCQRGREVVLRIAQLDDPIHCPNCGMAMNRQVSAPMVVGDYEPYSCPITGARIEGRKQHQENLAKHGCRIYEPGETQNTMRSKAAQEAALERNIEETTDRFIAGLPTDKRDSLAGALEKGLDVQVSRGSA